MALAGSTLRKVTTALVEALRTTGVTVTVVRGAAESEYAKMGREALMYLPTSPYTKLGAAV